ADYAQCQREVEERNDYLVRAMQGVDVLITDSSYTSAEYPAKKGWGHGTYQSSIAYAKQAGVKNLFCTHHEPSRSDDALEAAFAEALAEHPYRAGDPVYRLAREGDCFEF
ncbi:MAG: MBL fold metallo-hydrolase, partial [Rhodoferax sp.]|nr:MBL fold metallo-hydrolase [Rhodoferax sp.]